MVFPVIVSNWRHLESDAGFKTLLLHPSTNKNTAHTELATLSSGSRSQRYVHRRTGRESLYATHCNYLPLLVICFLNWF
jgi:type IV secretory pathway VirD2 relaxase